MGFPNLNATEAFARPSLLSGEGNGVVMKGFGLRSGEPNMENFKGEPHFGSDLFRRIQKNTKVFVAVWLLISQPEE